MTRLSQKHRSVSHFTCGFPTGILVQIRELPALVFCLTSLLLCITISADNEHKLDAMMGPEAVCKFSNTNS
jgi:hypothetical protein